MVPRPKKTGRLSDPSGLLPRTRRTRAPHLEPANRGKVEERRRDTSDSEHGPSASFKSEDFDASLWIYRRL